MPETIAKTTIEKTTLASVSRLCSTDVTRGPITHVLVTGSHVTATNSHALVQRRREEKDKEQAAEILVPAAMAAKAAKLGDKAFSVVTLERSKETAEHVGETVTMACGDTVRGDGYLSKFPDVACIIGEATATAADPARVVRLAINPELLLNAARALGWEPATKNKGAKGVWLSIPLPVARGDGTVPEGVTNPVVVRLSADAGNGDVAVVMPMAWSPKKPY